MKTLIARSDGMAGVVPARAPGIRGWQLWAPYAAVAWSLMYGALGVYWALGGRGFPYAFTSGAADPMGPLLGRFGPGAAWIVVMLAGLPAAAIGATMLRGVRSGVLRPLLITAGALLAGVLLLLMTGLDLLVMVGYIPAAVSGLFPAEKAQGYLGAWTQWTTIHQLLCIIGGFLWLAATVSYARRSRDACVYCGRREGAEGWQSPKRAARWGRIAVYVAMVAPVYYTLTRYAWAAGIPLGMSEEALRRGQESGTWIGGLSLATFGLVGALLMLGLVQHWGEIFPRWMIGLAGRRVPIALAVVPASLAAVLVLVGGVGIWSGLRQMVAAAATAGMTNTEIKGQVLFVLGPTLLFPVWGAALAAAALGYYYRRRGPCSVCGRGGSGESARPSPGEP
ncbi:MAG: hypothetical protein ACM3QS_16085 [Bacteroidota bacterium]